jgi:hypothetical protein
MPAPNHWQPCFPGNRNGTAKHAKSAKAEPESPAADRLTVAPLSSLRRESLYLLPCGAFLEVDISQVLL